MRTCIIFMRTWIISMCTWAIMWHSLCACLFVCTCTFAIPELCDLSCVTCLIWLVSPYAMSCLCYQLCHLALCHDILQAPCSIWWHKSYSIVALCHHILQAPIHHTIWLVSPIHDTIWLVSRYTTSVYWRVRLGIWHSWGMCVFRCRCMLSVFISKSCCIISVCFAFKKVRC